jgi:hypothetical protein
LSGFFLKEDDVEIQEVTELGDLGSLLRAEFEIEVLEVRGEWHLVKPGSFLVFWYKICRDGECLSCGGGAY